MSSPLQICQNESDCDPQLLLQVKVVHLRFGDHIGCWPLSTEPHESPDGIFAVILTSHTLDTTNMSHQ